ncbi:SipW-dependent-type signal peptide-containing protein [Rarobacter incanus]|uniref:Putative ribosomally synthesized peptide with SipW-like signal peptide n=1 Tax=Rarobacter incanus TaxID=153494 RepID=A0A542SPN8_9MICO|nr:SipW-dependent-type signal peptide-containing protein [Rarobacter incanus]TQK76525.1 putative ribosomally synthesized peptide with SipW-like signal peptide [Rarobacter incanus]
MWSNRPATGIPSWRTIVISLSALAAIVAVVVGVRTTSAAWNDQAHFAAPVTAGTWDTIRAADVMQPGNSNTQTGPGAWTVPAAPESSHEGCVQFNVTGTSATPEVWEVHADLTKPPFAGMSGSGGFYNPGPVQTTIGTLPGDSTTLVLRGVSNGGSTWNAEYNNKYLTSSQTINVKICSSSLPVPAQGNSNWTTIAVTHGTWTDTQACLVVTVTGTVTDTDANPFYFGWTYALDMTPAKQRITGAGKTVNYVGWVPSVGDGGNDWSIGLAPAHNNPVANTYTVTSKRTTAVRGTGTVTVTACVYGW